MTDKLGKIFETALNALSTLFQADDPADISQKQEAQLVNSFFEEFGQAGDTLVGEIITSPLLHGNKITKGPSAYFPGVPYSLPLTLYIVRRALDEELDTNEAFTHFINDIDRIVKNDEKNTGSSEVTYYPTKWFIESLTKPCLENLKKLPPPALPIEPS